MVSLFYRMEWKEESMAAYTTYKNLEKPDVAELYNINVANKNNDILDSELHKIDLKIENQNKLLATKQDLSDETLRSTTKENELSSSLASEVSRAISAENKNSESLAGEINRATIAEEDLHNSIQNHTHNKSNPHDVTKSQVGLGNADNTSDLDKPVSAAQQNALDSALSTHNTSESSHNDIRLLVSGLTARLNALADSDDTTLDQLSEIVAYIKNNKSLIEGVTTNKINVSDIIDDLTTPSADKPLSANQGKVLMGLINQSLGGLKFTGITQTEYDALEEKDMDMIYIITG